MVRHIVSFNYQEKFDRNQNRENALIVKNELETLVEKIDGIIELKVYIDSLDTSDRDLVLNSLFKNAEDLAAYQVHPEHQKVVAIVNTMMMNKTTIDYIE